MLVVCVVFEVFVEFSLGDLFVYFDLVYVLLRVGSFCVLVMCLINVVMRDGEVSLLFCIIFVCCFYFFGEVVVVKKCIECFSKFIRLDGLGFVVLVYLYWLIGDIVMVSGYSSCVY